MTNNQFFDDTPLLSIAVLHFSTDGFPDPKCGLNLFLLWKVQCCYLKDLRRIGRQWIVSLSNQHCYEKWYEDIFHQYQQDYYHSSSP